MPSLSVMLSRCVLVLFLLLVPLTIGAQTRNEHFSIEIGEPSIWSLEQAHYLLAKMRALDQGLQNAPPSGTDLDPNQIQATRMQLLQSTFNAEVSFDQTAGVKNQLALKTFNDDFSRKQDLRAQLDKLNKQNISISEQLTTLNAELQKLGTSDQQQQNILNAEIAGKKAEQAAIQSEITATQSEISSISLSTPTFTTPTLSSSPQLPSSALSKLMQGTQAGVGTPKLHASTVLDNYIQMQYEIIAKQLTLMREEVGPSNRLIFLELPYSIYTTPRNSNDRLVHVGWKVAGYYPTGTELGQITKDNYAKTTSVKYKTEMLFALQPSTSESTDEDWKNTICDETSDQSTKCRTQKVPYTQKDILALNQQNPGTFVRVSEGDVIPAIRVVDMIPRQSALNVNQTYDNVKGLALSLHFLEIFGLGGRVDYQRQRENYEQFVHQDAFVTGDGKGLTTFGWTFGPLPGSKQIAPGVRTTYAVLIVPNTAAAIKLDVSGYAFPRTELPQPPKESSHKNALVTRSFLITIPPTQEGFYLTSADYTPAVPGNYMTLYLRGTSFSPQVGVLVNGVPLQRVVGIAQQDLNLVAANAPNSLTVSGNPNTSGIKGQFEQVNQQTLTLAFTMGANFQGSPTISLVTPEKAVDIMYYKICVNRGSCKPGQKETIFEHAQSEPMFLAPLTLSGLKILSGDSTSHLITCLLSGTGFRPQIGATTTIRVNGNLLTPAPEDFVSGSIYKLSLYPTDAPTLDIVMTQQRGDLRNETIPLTIANPFRPQASQTEIITDSPQSGGSPAVMQVHLQGANLNLMPSVTVISGAAAAVPTQISGTDAVLTITSPREPITILLNGPLGQAGAALADGTFITIKRPQPPHIASITNPGTKNASGPKAGGYPVIIHGTNLSSVTDVLFGTNAAPILQITDTDLTVQVPTTGNSGNVQLALSTSIMYLGKKLDNSADIKSPNCTFAYTDK